ncbi:type I-C CRISPR-associated protein Cas5, partial [Paenibacillus larvae]|nr:type I-C CRISPR-associated protein Cas5 [Paenibacillus larvae]
AVIKFIRPEECTQVRTISEMKPKPFNEDNMQSVDDLYAQIEEGGNP